jgi:hypothetical protein
VVCRKVSRRSSFSSPQGHRSKIRTSKRAREVHESSAKSREWTGHTFKSARANRNGRDGAQRGGVNESDYIVVGGGTAGCVIATRLAARGHAVTLFEAGGPYSHILDIPLVGLWAWLRWPRRYCWDHWTDCAAGLGRALRLPRPRAQGPPVPEEVAPAPGPALRRWLVELYDDDLRWLERTFLRDLSAWRSP